MDALVLLYCRVVVILCCCVVLLRYCVVVLLCLCCVAALLRCCGVVWCVVCGADGDTPAGAVPVVRWGTCGGVALPPRGVACAAVFRAGSAGAVWGMSGLGTRDTGARQVWRACAALRGAAC